MPLSPRFIALVAAGGLAALVGASAAQTPASPSAPPAQTPGFNRTIVQKGDVSFPGHEAVVARIEVLPGVTGGWHTHPGDEIDYVLEGEADLLIAGQPPRKVKAGDAFVIPAGTVHNARNSGTAPLRVIGVYVVDKTKPLASPAPAPLQ